MKMFRNTELQRNEYIVAKTRSDIPDAIDRGYGEVGFWDLLEKLGASLDDYAEVPEWEMITVDGALLFCMPDHPVCHSAAFWTDYFGVGVPFLDIAL